MCEQNSKSVYCNVLPVAAREHFFHISAMTFAYLITSNVGAVGSSKHSNWIVSDLIELGEFLRLKRVSLKSLDTFY